MTMYVGRGGVVGGGRWLSENAVGTPNLKRERATTPSDPVEKEQDMTVNHLPYYVRHNHSIFQCHLLCTMHMDMKTTKFEGEALRDMIEAFLVTGKIIAGSGLI